MIVEQYKGYREGQDILQIPADFLTFPSKNCLVYKGKIVSRLGTKNDGNAPTGDQKVHSEYVWKQAPGGAKALRAFGTTLQVKIGSIWFTLFDDFDANTTRVRFTSWVDVNGSIIKSRLFMVDGSENIYEWNGAIANVASATTDNVTINDNLTLLQLGFDPGNASNKNIKIISRDADGFADDISEYAHADDLSGNNNLTITTTFSPAPASGDILIGSVIKHTDQLTGITKDEIYTYKNHLFVANFNSSRIYYSHAVDYLDFVIPGSKTAITPDLLDLDGNFTAMITRKDILWISTTDDWYKVTKTIEENEYGFWTNVEKFEEAESLGARPFAVAIQNGDVIFMSQDKRIRRIITLEVIGIDDIELISDNIDGLLDRLNLDDIRLYYFRRYVYMVSGNEGITIMLDTVEGEFQPPQFIGMSCMSVIDGVIYGHSNSRDETFELFSGRNDLGTEVEIIMAPGYRNNNNSFGYKKHDMYAMHARGTDTTKLNIDYEYEEFGAKVLKPATVEVKDLKKYATTFDVSFGGNPFGNKSFAGVDDEPDASLKGFFLFDRQSMVSWFNFRPVITISGLDSEFQLLEWYINEQNSEYRVDNELFIDRTE